MAEAPPRAGVAVARWLRVALSSIAAVLLFAMMVLVNVDVGGRYLFAAPLSGSFEASQFMLALLVFAALPILTQDDAHISVSVVDTLLRGWMRFVQRLLVLLTGVIALAVIAWRLWLQGRVLSADRQVTGYLEWPLAPLAYAMAALAALACTFALVMLCRHVIAGPGAPPAGGPQAVE